MTLEPRRILVVRRDNIGDLVCTTPMIAALRRRYPEATLAALVNSYNAPVLEGNPDLDAVHAYTKAKHGENVLASHWARLRLLLALRRQRFDLAIVGGHGAGGASEHGIRLAVQAGARHIAAFTADGRRRGRVDLPVPAAAPAPLHEVEDSLRLLSPLGPVPEPPPLVLKAAPAAVAAARTRLGAAPPGRLVGLHISARKPSQRWPAEAFAALAARIAARPDTGIVLFWAPGPEDDPRHPGDDGKAAALLAALPAGLPAFPMPTIALRELIAGLDLCDSVVCSDGGAMHLAAGLGKPIACLFGQSDAVRWHPWGVPHRVLQPAGRNVADLGVEEVLAAWAAIAPP